MEISFYITPSGRSPVEEFIRSLSKSDQARFADVYRGIKEYGFDCPRVVFKHLRGKLWEIKFSASGGGYRICYVTINRNTMIWLHAFKKTSPKTPLRDLELAEQRMKEIL